MLRRIFVQSFKNMNTSLFGDGYLQRIQTIDRQEEINVIVANALRFVIQNVFIHFADTSTLIISSDDGPIEYWLHDTMKKLFATWSFMALKLVVLDKRHKHIELPGKRHCNMIMIDSFKSLEKANIAEYGHIYDGVDYYFIFLQIQDDYLEQEMEKIFNYCHNNYWLNCNVMIQTSKGEIYIYTYFPFQDGACYQTQSILINQFVENRFVNSVMFPDKLENLHMCTLKFSAWEVPPFIIYKAHSKFPQLKISGLEMRIVEALSRDMNFTTEIQLTYPYKNRTYDPFSYIRDRTANVSIGYFQRTLDRDEIGTPSYITYYMPLVAIVLRRQDQYESIGILTFPFDKYTWILLGLSFCILTLLDYFQRNATNKVNSLQIFEVLIGTPSSTLPKDTSRRIRFVLWILSCFILRTIYQSLLFYLYSIHFYKSPPTTLHGLATGGYTTICSKYSSKFVQHVPQILDETLPLLVVNGSDEIEPLRHLEHHPKENLAVISIIDFAIYYSANELDNRNSLQVLPINVNDQQIVFYLTKHSYLIHRIDNCILRYHQAGLLEKWKEWANHKLKVTKSSGDARDLENELLVDLQQLIGFYFIILFFHLIAFVVFLLELLSKKFVCLKRFF